MNLSPEAKSILEEFRCLRERRERDLQRDLHFIDAAYDRQMRRIQATAIWNRTSCTCFSSKPFCLRRFCNRRLRWVRRQLSSGR